MYPPSRSNWWFCQVVGGYVVGSGDAEITKPLPASDSRLIAAAPDLLSALQAVADYWAGGDVPPEIDAQMRAAIARATSED
jgi:hypothetical protein